MSEKSTFAAAIVAWQRQAGRHDLPWQNTRDPYRIWLSEIMLQQTQVATVIPYYQRFLASFPDVASLAAAPVERVLAHWAGLGYYARARNLHRCAQEIMAVHGGEFPRSAAQLQSLSGIGRSTAAAIAAFAYGERAAILDGNVKRVLCRVFAIAEDVSRAAAERALWQRAESLLPAAEEMASYTQGLMDLGATLCTRRQPACARCPLADSCVAQREERQHLLPVARSRAKAPERQATFLLISDGQGVLLERRPARGIWGGLLAFPEAEAAQFLPQLGVEVQAVCSLPPLRHVFTHFVLQIMPQLCRVSAPPSLLREGEYCWLPFAAAAQAGVPAPVRTLLTSLPAVWAAADQSPPA
ncbi:A/G-specific adenine glycosylase [Azonexus hydrophilus]|uniref:A/G-specific adenine glycosylase n=1 Tax=Azonexus hydrophilus TaxID=418702 RepID=UPI001965BE13|nr:A/G-specific adenine glycosylase [Azonexus hydrophilus]